MRKMLILILGLGLCGCATTAKYETQLAHYVGTSEDTLVAAWGIPNKTYDLQNGKKALEFVSKKTVESGGYSHATPQSSYQSGMIGDKSYSGTSTTYVMETEPIRNYRLACKTTFVLNSNGKVESWSHEGNNCVSN